VLGVVGGSIGAVVLALAAVSWFTAAAPFFIAALMARKIVRIL